MKKKIVVSTLSWATVLHVSGRFSTLRRSFWLSPAPAARVGLWSNGVVLISSGFPLHTTANQLTTPVVTVKISFPKVFISFSDSESTLKIQIWKFFFSPNNHWHFFTVLLSNELGEVSSGVGWSSLVWVCVLWMFFTVINVINRRGLCRTESILKLTIAPTPDGAFRESFGVRWVVVEFFPFSGFGSFFFEQYMIEMLFVCVNFPLKCYQRSWY